MEALNFNTPRKATHFYILLSLAKADGFISPEETAFLKMYGSLAGITESEVVELIENYEHKDLMQLKIVNSLEKEKFLVDLIVLSMVDGVLSKEEKDKIYDLAANINISSITVDKYFRAINIKKALVKERLDSVCLQYAA